MKHFSLNNELEKFSLINNSSCVLYMTDLKSLLFTNYIAQIFIKYTNFITISTKLKQIKQDFPGGSVVKNLPASAGDMILIPHATEQLRPHATITEPVLESPEARTSEPTCRSFEAHTPQSPFCSPTKETTKMRPPHAATREQPPPTFATREKSAKQQRPSTAK